MPVAVFPYKRPYFQVTLTPAEIEVRECKCIGIATRSFGGAALESACPGVGLGNRSGGTCTARAPAAKLALIIVLSGACYANAL